MNSRSSGTVAHNGSEGVPRLALSHGQATWLMGELGLRHGVSESTFNHYIKSLRKLGIPFDKGRGQSNGHHHATYDFEALMELTIALLLRVYGTLPDPVVLGIKDHRESLRRIYRQSYLDLVRRTHPAACVFPLGGPPMMIEGLFLDLNIRYLAGRMVAFGPPRAMSPFEAIVAFAHAQAPARSYLPLNVTALAGMIIGGTRRLPDIRRSRTATGRVCPQEPGRTRKAG